MVSREFSVAMIEHKAGKASDLLDELCRLDVVERVIVQSFDWSFLRAIHALEPKLAQCWLQNARWRS